MQYKQFCIRNLVYTKVLYYKFGGSGSNAKEIQK